MSKLPRLAAVVLLAIVGVWFLTSNDVRLALVVFAGAALAAEGLV